jgi:hypothetical protein
MSAPTTTSKFLEGMRLSDHERGLLIDQMKKSGAVERRKNPRLIVDGTFSMLLTMDSPGGNSSCFRIYPWDLSKGGIGFFHRSFVYPGTRCTFAGVTFSGKPFNLTGEVVRCSHVSGHAHAVGTKLDTEIEPEDLIGPHALGGGAGIGQASSDDWWAKFGGFAAELAKLARERATPEAIRACVASVSMHACTQPSAKGAGAAKAERPRSAA